LKGGFFLQVLDLGSPQQRNPPGGEFHTIKLGGVQRTGGSRVQKSNLLGNRLKAVVTQLVFQ